MAKRGAKVGSGEVKYQRQKTVTPAQDAAYLAAVERGDTAEAQRMVDEAAKAAVVTVPEHALSLAIGREGQNARLAARLTGYRIDIASDGSGTPPAAEPTDGEAVAVEGEA
jgi:hypothetical protein